MQAFSYGRLFARIALFTVAVSLMACETAKIEITTDDGGDADSPSENSASQPNAGSSNAGATNAKSGSGSTSNTPPSPPPPMAPLPGVNLESVVDFLDRPLSSSNAGPITFTRSAISFETGWYDGSPQYYFEIVAKNTDTTPHFVVLVDSVQNWKSTIDIPANTAQFKRFRAPFYVNANIGNYRVMLAQTAAAGQIVVSAARLIVQQSNATATRIYIPLMGDTVANATSAASGQAGSVDFSSSFNWSQPTPYKYNYWRRNLNAYATVSNITFDVTMNVTNNGSGDAYAGLYNATTGQYINDSILSTGNAGVPMPVQATFSPNAPNFTEGHDITVRIAKNGVGATSANLYRAGLWIALNIIQKGEVYYRVGAAVNGNVSGTNADLRALLDLSRFTKPYVYFESTGAIAAGAVGARTLADFGNGDTGGASNLIVNGSVAYFNNTTSDRTGSLSIVSGRQVGVDNTMSGTMTSAGAFAVVGFSR